VSTYRRPRVTDLRIVRLPVAIAFRRDGWWLSGLFGLALTLRLIFVLSASRIQVVWDAAAYWINAQAIRASACDKLPYCQAAPGPRMSKGHAVDVLVFSKDGVMPLLQGLLLTVFPNSVTTALVGFALLDAIACVMIAAIALRLGAPLWVGVLAGGLMAVYVPGIIGDGSFLQQPLIRFALVGAVWCYACALTSDRSARRWVGAGTGFLVLVAFTSESTRPLLWIVPAAVIALTALRPHTRQIAVLQLRASAYVAASLVLAAVAITLTISNHTFAEALTNLGLGLSTSGTASGQTTVLSFQDFWPSDAWTFFANSNATQSLMHDFTRAPGEFTKLWAYSTYANWRYPDFLYFQNFGLGSGGQTFEHIAILVPGFAGFAWLLGQAGPRRLIGAVALVTIAVTSVIASVISVEPRRVGALVPLVALGAACFAWSFVHRRTWRRFEAVGVAALALFAVVWAASVPDVLTLFPLSPHSGHWLLVLARTAATVLLGVWILRDWRRHWDGFTVLWPAALGAGVLLLTTGSQLYGVEWRAWAATIQTPVRQQVDGLRAQAHMQPWLIADFASPSDAAAAAIYVNGSLLKSSGTPMRHWQVDGQLLGWAPYATLEQMSGRAPHTWMAFPLSRKRLSASRLTIEIRPPDAGVRLAGDYTIGSSSQYSGPSLDPSLGELSFWRWGWNAGDPRIPRGQNLGARYASSRLGGRIWRSGDLSPAFGKQTGRFRVYVSQQPFGPETNILQGPSPPAALPPSRCAPGTGGFVTAAATGESPYVCEPTGGAVTYYSGGGVALGSSNPAVFPPAPPPGTLVDTRATKTGTIEVIALGGPLYVANIFGPRHTLRYSLGFSYPAYPPLHF
jgi:hypothetical protein